jgi:predicted transcriptional regulator
MKSVLISIKPKWCELIALGKKTVEVRKTRPKLETPFKCYIYCTVGKSDKDILTFACFDSCKYMGRFVANGKVIGEFVCDTFIIDKTFGHDALFNAAACLSDADAASYCLNNEMYGWHISNLVIYDKPRELSEFYTLKKCRSCESGYESTACIYDEDCRVPAPITRPPQSWCYVESEDTE